MKRKLSIICICAFAAAGISTGIISNINSEADVNNKKAVGAVERYATEKEAQKESVKQDTNDRAISDKALQSAEVTESHVAKKNSKSVNYKADIGSKKRSTEKVSTNSPVHIHDWKPVTKTDNIKSQVPVYGDVCRSCNKNVTGWADKHLLESDCTGYDTDVIVSYEEVTEKITYTVYECSCGAIK